MMLTRSVRHCRTLTSRQAEAGVGPHAGDLAAVHVVELLEGLAR